MGLGLPLDLQPNTETEQQRFPLHIQQPQQMFFFDFAASRLRIWFLQAPWLVTSRGAQPILNPPPLSSICLVHYIPLTIPPLEGTTPHTVSNKEWWEETDKKLQAWPRTAGPPVVMNPISRQNFIVKSHTEA
ncbi:hypothetical protein L484_003281 [Morus notabilis]|uniref:Uncharacterized protein n=1 Tax=Morus notabilis TaxID=981085 RepID=W9RTH4_9ROSA|nr:hypothetical protein L484_003281 [Morus notabilis]